MLVTIIFIIIFIISAIRICTEWYNDTFEKIAGVIGSIFICSLFWILSFLILAFTLPRTITYTNHSIININDNSSVSGAFFLGSGTVDGKMAYSFYQKDGNGAKLEQVNARDVIVYQDTEKPYIIRETGCTGDWQWIAECGYDSTVLKEIHVLKGSIKNNFDLDAK